VLEHVVEHDRVRSARHGIGNATTTVGIRDDRHVWIQRPMHHRLIRSVPAQDHGGVHAAVRERTRKPRGNRRLAGAPNREIANAE
jgi:hypothetical protein